MSVVYMVRPDGSELGLLSCRCCAQSNVVRPSRRETTCWAWAAPVAVTTTYEDEEGPATCRRR